MKALLIAFNNLKYSPYVGTYARFLEKKGISYDVVRFDRSGIPEQMGQRCFSVAWDQRKSRIANFLAYRSRVGKLLRENNYDFVAVLTTVPAVLLGGILSRKLKGRYLVDIRDYTYEYFLPYRLLERRCLNHAAMKVISSPGFREFLPRGDYHLCHNMSYDIRQQEDHFCPEEDGPVVIGYVGSMSRPDYVRRMIRLVEKDERFAFHFYGVEAGETRIREDMQSLRCPRIRCFGGYEPSQKGEILRKVDILFNAYGNDCQTVRQALSNKLYDACYYKKPLITNENTVMSTMAGDYSWDLQEDTEDLDGLLDWYRSLDGEKMTRFMADRLSDFQRDMDDFYRCLGNLLEEPS